MIKLTEEESEQMQSLNINFDKSDSPLGFQNSTLSYLPQGNNRLCNLIKLLVPSERHATGDRSPLEFLSKLILEIIDLKEKLAQPDKQNFYFKSGLQSNISRYASLRKQFGRIKKEVNNCDADRAIEQIKEHESNFNKCLKHNQPGIMKAFALSGLTAKIQHLRLILGLKTKMGIIKPLNYYLQPLTLS